MSNNEETGSNFHLSNLVMYTIDHNPHYWFPCVNSYNELSTWKIEVAVEEDLKVISSGNLIEIEDLGTNYMMLNEDVSMSNSSVRNTYKRHHFYLSTPTAPPNIGLCVGYFDSLKDENMNEICYYFENGLEDLVKQTTSSLHEIFEFYEDLFTIHFHFTTYKQVYLNNILEEFLTFSGLTVLK